MKLFLRVFTGPIKSDLDSIQTRFDSIGWQKMAPTIDQSGDWIGSSQLLGAVSRVSIGTEVADLGGELCKFGWSYAR